MKNIAKKTLSKKIAEGLDQLFQNTDKANKPSEENQPITTKGNPETNLTRDKSINEIEIIETIAKDLEIITRPDNYIYAYKKDGCVQYEGVKFKGVKLTAIPNNWEELGADTLEEYLQIYQQPCYANLFDFPRILEESMKLLSDQSRNMILKFRGKMTTIKKDYELITNNTHLCKILPLLMREKIIAVDTETTGLDPHKHKLRLVQFAIANNRTYIVDCFKCDITLLQPLLKSKSIKVFHNGKFDLQFFIKHGLEINQSFFDTCIAYQLITAGDRITKYSLKETAIAILNEELDKENQLSDWEGELTESQLKYAAKDAQILLPLREKLREEIIKADLTEVAKIEFDCILTMALMEFNGMLIDLDKWKNIIKETEIKRAEVEKKLQGLLKIPSDQLELLENSKSLNLNSTTQLLNAFSHKGIKLTDTSFNTLSALAPDHLEIELLLEYRKLQKLLSSFGENLIAKINPVTAKLHPTYLQLGASSGRLSCSNPNLQQIPRSKEVRSCFVASPGNKLVIADYSQIELRIAAEIANDTDMIEAYKRNEDLHKLTASIILNKKLEAVTKEDRQIAKSANFGLLYGAGVNGFRSYAQNNYGVKLTESEAKNIIDRFFQRYKGLAKWHKQTKNNNYAGQTQTRTLLNRRRLFSELGVTQALNTPVQGTGADILKLSLSKLPSALTGTKALILATVHDEIILECPENEVEKVAKILSTTMINAGLQVLKNTPIECEASHGDNWADK